MTKAGFISAVAKNAKMTKVAAAQAIDAMTKDLKKGGRITIPGFGTFSMANRKARTGRNPRTGQEIRIPARKTARFKPGKTLKEAVR